MRFGPPVIPPSVRIKLLSPTAKAPQYMTAGAAGADVFADFHGIVDPWLAGIGSTENAWGPHDGGQRQLTAVRLDKGTHRIPLGFSAEIPSGWVGLLKGRSGLASLGHDAHVAAVDSDYRGGVCMLLHVSEATVRVTQGDRVGQILFMPAPQFELRVVDELSETVRGGGGFGSTGSR